MPPPASLLTLPVEMLQCIVDAVLEPALTNAADTYDSQWLSQPRDHHSWVHRAPWIDSELRLVYRSCEPKSYGHGRLCYHPMSFNCRAGHKRPRPPCFWCDPQSAEEWAAAKEA